MKSNSTNCANRYTAFVARYSLTSVFVIVTLLSVALSVWVNNASYWGAVSALRARSDVEVVFARSTPSFLDRLLGDYRFDDVYEVKAAGHEIPRISPEIIRNLRGLRRFDGDELRVLDAKAGDVEFLLPHRDTLESLSITYSQSPVTHLGKFSQLKELSLQSPLDVSQLSCLRTLVTLRCRYFSPENVSLASGLEVLDLSDLSGDQLCAELHELKEISNLRALHLHELEQPLDLKKIGVNHPNLEYLTVKNVEIQEFASLAELAFLKGTELDSCSLTGRPSSLENLDCLELCYITRCNLSDWDWLKGSSALTHLMIDFELESEVSLNVLDSLPNLEVLILRNCKVSGIHVPTLPSLKTLRLQNGQISDRLLAEFKRQHPGSEVILDP